MQQTLFNKRTHHMFFTELAFFERLSRFKSCCHYLSVRFIFSVGITNARRETCELNEATWCGNSRAERGSTPREPGLMLSATVSPWDCVFTSRATNFQ